MVSTSVQLRPWEEGFDLPDEFNMVQWLLERHLHAGHRERIAIHCGDITVTYGELGDRTNRIGNALSDIGISPGDRIILLLYDSPDFVAVFLGAMKIGAVPVPINIMATEEDLFYFISDSGAKAIVVESDLYAKVAPVLPKCEPLPSAIVRNGDEAGCENLSKLMASASGDLDVHPTAKTDPSYWLYTSGTTGQPKGVVHLHKDLAYAVETWGDHVVGFSSDDTVYCVSKLYFSYGLNNGLYLPLTYGASVVLSPDRPLPANVLSIIERYRPTGLFAVPTGYGQILNYMEEKDVEPDVSSLRFCISAGEALPGPIYQRWVDKFGIDILDGLGSSEVGFIYISNRPGRVKKNASGLLLPGYQAEIRDDAGNTVPAGEVGNLWVKSNTLLSHYWNKPEKTAETLVDGWLKTGDRLALDEDGYFYFGGRADDAMKVSGIWVSPLEVEEAVLSYPAVAECAVVGHEDAMGLTKPKAFVALKKGFEPSEELADELKKFVKSNLAPYKYPRWIEFTDELPKTSTGKIQRFKLRDI